MLRAPLLATLLALPFLATCAPVAPTAEANAAVIAPRMDRTIVATDGIRLHVIEAGPRAAHTIVLIPGWTMPAWIFDEQISHLSRTWHVVALDPRGQGDSDIPATGYDAARRGQDIADLIAQLGPAPVVLAGWSLGVLDSLAYLRAHGDQRIAGLVLIDNSVGEDPAPIARPAPRRRAPPIPHAVYMRSFVRGMFHTPQPDDYLDRLTLAALRTPEPAAAALLNYHLPRTAWRDALYGTTKPVLYAVRPAFAAQAANLQARRPNTRTEIFREAGHALFVDEPARFDALVDSFLAGIWPRA